MPITGNGKLGTVTSQPPSSAQDYEAEREKFMEIHKNLREKLDVPKGLLVNEVAEAQD